MAFMAKIVVKTNGKIIHRESKTFDRRPAAVAWAAKREKELKQPGEIERAKRPRATLADAIDKYTEDSLKRIGKTKAQVLDTIKGHSLAAMECADITSADIVAFAQELATARKPSTVGNYLSHLASVFSIARAAWGMPLDRAVMEDAQLVCRRLGLIAKSDERDRRPTLDELDKLMHHFADRQRRRPTSVPMVHIVAFAIFSTRRQEEIIRIEWRDLDERNSRILVRDMKNPGEKQGNHVWCNLPPEAMRIIQAMPRIADQIFPYTTDAIGAAFTRACRLLGIEDLRFHDLRHEGISRLFELGGDIPRVALVSGHRSWTSLKRYTHIKQSGDKYAGWRWLQLATTPPDIRLHRNGQLPRRRRSERQLIAAR
jgi:integrase